MGQQAQIPDNSSKQMILFYIGLYCNIDTPNKYMQQLRTNSGFAPMVFKSSSKPT